MGNNIYIYKWEIIIVVIRLVSTSHWMLENLSDNGIQLYIMLSNCPKHIIHTEQMIAVISI